MGFPRDMTYGLASGRIAPGGHAHAKEVVRMTMADVGRRDAVLRELDRRSRRQAAGRAGRRAAVIRVAVALRLASAVPPPRTK